MNEHNFVHLGFVKLKLVSKQCFVLHVCFLFSDGKCCKTMWFLAWQWQCALLFIVLPKYAVMCKQDFFLTLFNMNCYHWYMMIHNCNAAVLQSDLLNIIIEGVRYLTPWYYIGTLHISLDCKSWLSSRCAQMIVDADVIWIMMKTHHLAPVNTRETMLIIRVTTESFLLIV